MALVAGDRLGTYEILAAIGAGGMGEVYRARDTRLGRTVAVKICREEFNERFEREARAVAALNHPNICALCDVGPNYLVMEFVAGEKPRGPVRLEEALSIAKQICEALQAAHGEYQDYAGRKRQSSRLRPGEGIPAGGSRRADRDAHRIAGSDCGDGASSSNQ